jgi:hypothetical protein
MTKRVCVFVDGENFRFTINDIFSDEFQRHEYLPKRADWAGFFDWLVGAVTACAGERLRTYWYVLREIEFFPYHLPRAAVAAKEGLVPNPDLVRLIGRLLGPERETLDAPGMIARLEELSRELKNEERRMRARFEGWIQVQRGIASRHKAIEFRREGAIQYDLFTHGFGSERSVDVKLATDMIVLSPIFDIALLVSGDQDYVPAVKHLKNAGRQVFSVTFLTKEGVIVPPGAKRLHQVTDDNAMVPYAEFRRFLFAQDVMHRAE